MNNVIPNSLEITNLRTGYNNSNFQLHNINLIVPKGSVVGFVGQNGAGKTTTISSIVGAIAKIDGSIKLFDEEISDINTNKKLKNDIGLVLDNGSFVPNLKIKHIDKIMSDIFENWESEMFYNYLQKFGIHNYKTKIKEFSRGMVMKVSIAVALSHKAKFLILDEATAGLDPISRDEILDVFLEFMENEEHSILISSHISSDLEKIADYITFIHNGEIILTEKKDTIIYEYGIGKMKSNEFEKIDKSDYIKTRKNGLQREILIKNKDEFSKKYKDILVDSCSIDEAFALLIRGEKI